MNALRAFPQNMALVARLSLLVDQIAADELELTRRQTAVLLFLGLNDGPQQFRDVASAIGLQKGSLFRALRALRGLGLIITRRSEGDRRDVLVSITEAGLQFLRRRA